MCCRKQSCLLLVGIGEIVARRQAAALLGAEGRVGQDQVGLGQRLALGAERVAVADAGAVCAGRCRAASGSSARGGGCPAPAPCRRRSCAGSLRCCASVQAVEVVVRARM